MGDEGSAAAVPARPRDPLDGRYDALIAREAEYWDSVDRDPENPQLWDDPVLWEMVLAAPYRRLIEGAARSGGPVLELGCGDGHLALELARRGLDVSGVDLSPVRIERARADAARAGVASRARFEVVDLNTWGPSAGSLACVVAHNALHHVLRVESLLDRVAAALRPGGTLLVVDFIGTGWLEKLLSAAAVAVLPTRRSYATKWRLRGRLRALLASERAKRAALEGGAMEALHHGSPFEAVSQASILSAIEARFEVVEHFDFCPYWYHAVPKLRVPVTWQRAWIGTCRRWDEPLNRRGWTRGSYAFVEARRPS